MRLALGKIVLFIAIVLSVAGVALRLLDWFEPSILLSWVLLFTYAALKGKVAHLTKRQKVNYVVAAVWTVAFLNALVVSPSLYGSAILTFSQTHENVNVIEWAQGNSTHLFTQTYVTTLSAVGGFSVGGNVSYTIIETDSGDIPPANSTVRYTAVGFSNATYSNGSQLTLLSLGNGEYKATGYIWFANEGVTNFVVGTDKSYILSNDIQLSQSDVSSHHVTEFTDPWTIGPVSATDTVIFNEWAVKVSFVLGSFSILFLQPVISDILVRNRDDK